MQTFPCACPDWCSHHTGGGQPGPCHIRVLKQGETCRPCTDLCLGRTQRFGLAPTPATPAPSREGLPPFIIVPTKTISMDTCKCVHWSHSLGGSGVCGKPKPADQEMCDRCLRDKHDKMGGTLC